MNQINQINKTNQINQIDQKRDYHEGSGPTARCLENEGVQWIFGVPGEETLDVLNSLVDSKIRFIAHRHEQGAAFMADVHGRLSGKAGVCLSTLGPRRPICSPGWQTPIWIAPRWSRSRDKPRWIGCTRSSHHFIDVLSMFKPSHEMERRVFHPRTMAETVRKAFKVAQTEKPGSTHLELTGRRRGGIGERW